MLYYSHVNEDNRIERQLLSDSGCQVVVAVAGSGERVLSLMDLTNCTELHVIDPNEEALFLLQLKLTALKNLSVEDYLIFCGHETAPKGLRLNQFDEMKGELSPSCSAYWDIRRHELDRGILNIGQYERFLARVRPVANTFLGNGFMEIFSHEHAMGKHFPTRRWAVLRSLFAQRWVYRLFGNRDDAFVANDTNNSLIPNALHQIIQLGEAPACFMMHLLFKGHLRDMDETDLPPSLQKQVLTNIKERLDKHVLTIHYHPTDLLDFASSCKTEANKSVFYSLSDLLSFENYDYLLRVFNRISEPGAVIVWRSFLRNRLTLSDTFAKNLNGNLHLHAAESTRMYQVCSLQTPSNA